MELAKLNKIATQIAKIQDLDGAVDLRNKVRAIETYTKATTDCREIEREAGIARLRCERRIGKLLAKTVKAGNPNCATGVMKKRLLIAFAVVVGLCVFAYPYARDALMQFDRAAQHAFDSLPMGITLDDASARLGSDPIRDAPECCLPQRHAFESEFERAENSDAVHFYLYRNGINWYYCLGFDADGQLVVTGQGCS